MKNDDAAEQRRVLLELLETAAGLNQHGVISKSELREVRELCATPPLQPLEQKGIDVLL